ncbi:MAG: histidine kinase [Clostridium sp.]|nr:histidine kinase [Clostridium sp.]MDU7083432.1 histidine kinase [Clostridium sp.]
MEEKKRVRKKSLNRNIVLFCIFCWLVPITIIYLSMTTSYKDNIQGKLRNMFVEKLRSTDVFISNYLDEAIDAARKPSYEYYLERAWEQYKADGNEGRNDCYMNISSNLRNKFFWDKRFDICAFYLEGEDNPFTYLSSNNYPMGSYMEEVHDAINELRKVDSSYAEVIVVDGRIFIVRNVYTISSYEKFGTLVLELNRKNMFSDITLDEGQFLGLCINDADGLVLKPGFTEEKKRFNLAKEVLEEYSSIYRDKLIIKQDNDYYAYLLEEKHDDYHLGLLLMVDKAVIDAELNHLYSMIYILILIMGPILIFIIYFLKKQITAPISKLVEASREMESGKLGVAIDGEDMPNQQFQYLQNSFNRMSKQVQYLFDYAYDEKLARKDAKILALQAQINPHFLNNTLEIMNWQARMSGDVTLSKMIESLGTVLDYHMDREDKRLIRLSEELRCADAYLYIISMRFGKRLVVEKEIDEDLLQAMVPQLILQPILENAVVHGIETVSTGVIEIKIYHDDKKIYVQVVNTGKPMTEEDKERVKKILSGDPDAIKPVPGKHASLGIRNVNERIKLIYGKRYGLTIEPIAEDKTRSLITIPYTEEDDEAREEIISNIAKLNK